MYEYHPALRFKQGEYNAAWKIPRIIQDRIVPLFIVPPPKEHDPEIERVPTLDEIGYLTGERIGKHWPIRAAYLDTQYVAEDLRDEGVERLFDVARRKNSRLIPVARVSDLVNPMFQRLIASGTPKVGIHVPYDMADPDTLIDGVKALGCSTAECTLFVDFVGADLEPERAAGSIIGVLEGLGQAAPWHKLVFQGSAFPAKNPAEDGGNFLVPRNEMKSFLAAMQECMIPPHLVGYSDFAADCGEINFPRGKGGGKAIRHLRYTTRTDTMVVRGKKTGSDTEAMRDVCSRIVAHTKFAGRAFSYADNRIWEISKGRASCGNASMWREWNTAHHLTRVVRDLGELAGLTFSDIEVGTEMEQLNLLEGVE